MIHGHLLSDEQHHPQTQVDFRQHDGDEVGVDQALLQIGRKGEQPEVRGQHGDTRDGRRMPQHSDGSQTHPDSGLCHQEQAALAAALFGGNQERQQHDDDQGAHPQHVVGHVGLVGQQDPDAQGRCGDSKHRIFAQFEREGEVHDACVQQGQSSDEERHGSQHERHQFGPRNTTNNEV